MKKNKGNEVAICVEVPEEQDDAGISLNACFDTPLPSHSDECSLDLT